MHGDRKTGDRKPGTVHSIRISESNRHSSLRMSRIARAVVEGMPHHITQRGNGRSHLSTPTPTAPSIPIPGDGALVSPIIRGSRIFSEIADSTPLNTNFLMRFLAENLLVMRPVCRLKDTSLGNGKNPSDKMLPIISLILSRTYVKCGCTSIVDPRNPEHEGCFPKVGSIPLRLSAQNRSLQMNEQTLNPATANPTEQNASKPLDGQGGDALHARRHINPGGTTRVFK